ncbi:four-carbon acid sugar kinase family protein [Gracilibacillus sp. S3-1-1]|uniref:Four-carbon acid sugar kinase family protein n=1 Tax=Gracilibacillus pellucidus TaxID=3095368 RepID=A0ACC6M3W9_9BACI|nr:four-carbon acid sugar kinase family protein [Gracilibacillus sp. S3-1-1]MDX8045512.1 four-carbon acid sugar kinase family protein [Gracilibacillus sp. S3-1-1]
MKIAIVADDLTGACDTGVQLVQYDLDVSVVIQSDTNDLETNKDVIIFNTDSRAMTNDQAYLTVSETCEQIKEMTFDIVYKKIDSTMRGNIGSELNAIYDKFQPDFVFITPAHPSNRRVVKDGIHYLDGIKLSKTEVANDPKTPVHESDVSKLIQHSSGRSVKHLTYKDLRKGNDFIRKRLRNWKKQGISYITVDAVIEEDLKRLMDVMNSDYRSVLCGSAGLINYLPALLGYRVQEERNNIQPNNKPVLFVVGSISKVGRQQLEHLLSSSDVVGVEMDSAKILTGYEVKEKEVTDIQSTIKEAIMAGKSVALYSSADVDNVKTVGIDKGIHPTEISDWISKALGDIAVSIVKALKIRNLFLTGGDTAQQVFTRLRIKNYQLIGELELGVPIGKIGTQDEIITVTKAGSFGTIQVMTNVLKQLNNSSQDNKVNF